MDAAVSEGRADHFNQSKLDGLRRLVDKIIARDTRWEKTELLDALYWAKQLIAIVLGVVWGLVPLQGMFGFLLFGITLLVAITLFARNVLGIDEEEHGGTMDLMKDGIQQTVATFLLLWILTYSATQK